MNSTTAILSWDGDHIGRVVGRATLADNVDEVRRVDAAIRRGNEIFTSWALASGGSVVESGGDEGRIEIPAVVLDELPQVRHNYASAVGAPASVGIGKKLSESAKALMAAKLRGGDQVVFYDESVEAEVAEATAQEKPESEKLAEEYLNKATVEGSAESHHRGGVSIPTKSHPGRQTEEHSEGEVARSEAGPPPSPHEEAFHAAAADQDKADRAASIRGSADFDAIKTKVATALEGLKAQLPVLNQIKTTHPETYKSVLAMVQATIGLARELSSQDTALAKAESRHKVWRPASGWNDTLAIPSSGHPDRKNWDASILSNIAARYTNGDVTALKPVLIHPDEVVSGGNSAGTANPERLKLYSKMFGAGDAPHPVVVAKTSGGYHLIDGTHRLEAARTAGTKLPAVLVPRPVTKGEKNETEPDEKFPPENSLDKGAPDPSHPHRHLVLPVGTINHGEIKVQHNDGTVGWKGVKASMIAGQEPGGVGGGGANTHAVSSREPGSR